MNIQINNNLERKAYSTEELASYVSFIGVGWDGVNFPSKVLIFCSSARVTCDKNNTDYLQVPWRWTRFVTTLSNKSANYFQKQSYHTGPWGSSSSFHSTLHCEIKVFHC